MPGSGNAYVFFDVTEQSQVGAVRRHVASVATNVGFSEKRVSDSTIVATELAANLVRHTPGGGIIVKPVTLSGKQPHLDFWAIDRGPGIADMLRSMQDGYSTRGGSGTGLGAIKRLACEFDIFSQVDRGTVAFARMKQNRAHSDVNGDFQWACLIRPAPNEEVSGDGFAIEFGTDSLACLMVDGLGHGILAAEAAQAAIQGFVEHAFDDFTNLVVTMDRRLRGTRGAAAATARWDARTGQLNYVSIGNIAGSIRHFDGGKSRGLVSQNGTLGLQVPKLHPFTYDSPLDALVIMHSDGLQSRWNLDLYPALIHRHPGVIAGVLYRDFTRGRDDVTVAAIRYNREPRNGNVA